MSSASSISSDSTSEMTWSSLQRQLCKINLDALKWQLRSEAGLDERHDETKQQIIKLKESSTQLLRVAIAARHADDAKKPCENETFMTDFGKLVNEHQQVVGLSKANAKRRRIS